MSETNRTIITITEPSGTSRDLRAFAVGAGLATGVAIYNRGATTFVGSHEIIGLAVFAAAATSAVAEFAFSAICGAMLFQTSIAPVDTVTIMAVCSIANQALSVWALRR